MTGNPTADILPASGAAGSCSNGHLGVDVWGGLLVPSRQNKGRSEAWLDCGHDLGDLRKEKTFQDLHLTTGQTLFIEHPPRAMRIQPESVS